MGSLFVTLNQKLKTEICNKSDNQLIVQEKKNVDEAFKALNILQIVG